MPVLPNPKHEAFAQSLASGTSPADAYIQAGYKPNRGNAAALKAKQPIRKRVEELQQSIALALANRVAGSQERMVWDAADRLEMLERIARANEHEDPRVAVVAMAEANKMQGSYLPSAKDIAANTATGALAEALARTLDAKPALPVGQHLRIVKSA